MKNRIPLRLLLSLVIALILSSTFYYVVCAGLRIVKRDAIGYYNYIFSDTTYYNAVFFGASTLRLGINPLLFDSITGQHSYNASADGIAMPEINLLVKKYIASHGAPKNIFICFNQQSLAKPLTIWSFPQYYPFVTDTALNRMKAIEPKLWLGIYAPAIAGTYLDDMTKNLGLIGLKEHAKKEYASVKMRGYAYNPLPLRKPVPVEPSDYVSSDEGLQLLENTLDNCAQNKVHVTFILPPTYNTTPSAITNKLLLKLKQYEIKYHCETIDFGNNPVFNSSELFSDRIHLNNTGAVVFTKQLAEYFNTKPTQE